MLSTGPVHYEVGGNVDATCFGGIAAVHRVVTRLGLPEAIDTDLELLKVHLPYHESDHVLNLAYNVACGGTRLEDIERLRIIRRARGITIRLIGYTPAIDRLLSVWVTTEPTRFG